MESFIIQVFLYLSCFGKISAFILVHFLASFFPFDFSFLASVFYHKFMSTRDRIFVSVIRKADPSRPNGTPLECSLTYCHDVRGFSGKGEPLMTLIMFMRTTPSDGLCTRCSSLTLTHLFPPFQHVLSERLRLSA